MLADAGALALALGETGFVVGGLTEGVLAFGCGLAAVAEELGAAVMSPVAVGFATGGAENV